MSNEEFWKNHPNPYPMKKFRFNDDFTVDVTFLDGKAKRYNVKPYVARLPMIRYLLDSIELFKHPKELAEDAIRWDDNADITAEWIYEDGVDIEPF